MSFHDYDKPGKVPGGTDRMAEVTNRKTCKIVVITTTYFTTLLFCTALLSLAFMPPVLGTTQNLVSGSGATTVQNLFANLILRINRAFHVGVVYRPIGAGEGRREFVQAVTQFGASPIPLQPSEEAQLFGVVKYTLPFVIQTITVFTNIPGNPVLKFTPSLLAGIFQRYIRRWDHPAILALNPSFKPQKNAPITLVVRADLSGVTSLFTQFLALTNKNYWKLGYAERIKWPEGTVLANFSTGVVAKARTTLYSITYLGTPLGVAAGLTESFIKNPSGVFLKGSAANLLQSLPRPIPSAASSWNGVTLLLKPGKQTWPITSFVYFFVRQNQVQSGKAGGLLVSWLKFVISSQTQKILPKYGFVAIPQYVQAQNLAAIKRIILAPGVVPPF